MVILLSEIDFFVFPAKRFQIKHLFTCCYSIAVYLPLNFALVGIFYLQLETFFKSKIAEFADNPLKPNKKWATGLFLNSVVKSCEDLAEFLSSLV